MRRDFTLPEEDIDCLNAMGLNWEAVDVNGAKWIFFRGYKIYPGYNVGVADAAVRLPPLYPDDQIDMVYFFPALSLKSGRGMGALTSFNLENKQYQQWSRHRTAANPWRAGVDTICTHMIQVDSWLEREVQKG
jgi:hypothetical protein